MAIIRRGAEAMLLIEDGVIIKKRLKKTYRHPSLDNMLRKRRTRCEARNLKRARESGIPAPKVLGVDEKNHCVRMELIPGELLKDIFFRGEQISAASTQTGRILRKLHDAGIVHNDLTTSNLIWSGSAVHMIDFGLSFFTRRLEDRAMDLVVFKKSIKATHSRHSDAIWESLMEGYGPEKPLFMRVKSIESRVRYKSRQ